MRALSTRACDYRAPYYQAHEVDFGWCFDMGRTRGVLSVLQNEIVMRKFLADNGITPIALYASRAVFETPDDAMLCYLRWR